MFKKYNRNKKCDNNQKEDDESKNLPVFGYSCHLYASPNDQDPSVSQLIAWNGDDNIKIDRYDCRLYLSSLGEFENYDKLAKEAEDEDDYTTAEKLEEEMCDEERFVDMYDDIRKSEENERLKRGRGAEIGFSYDENTKSAITLVNDESSSSEEEIEEPYVCPDRLKLPVGIHVPETMKQSAIIERTAMFVVAKGPQMEIVIKLKQRNNIEQFGFLDFDNRLNSFYKYICKLIRENKYAPTPAPPKMRPKQKKLRRLAAEEAARKIKEEQENKQKPTNALQMIALDHGSESEGSSSDDKDEGYLHPLLMANRYTETKNKDFPTIGPMPQPKPVEPAAPDFNEVLAQLHNQIDCTDNVYSSLFKSLNSIIPGSKVIAEDVTKPTDGKKESNGGESKIEITYETDESKITEYNQWHLSFYGTESAYAPLGPPVSMPPPPNLSSPLNIAARYVAMNGSLAEQKLIDHNGDNCSFLFSSSPYYTYYQTRVRQIQWSLNQAYLSSIQGQQQQPSIHDTSTTSSLAQLEPSNIDTLRQPTTLKTDQIQLMPTELTVNNEKSLQGIEGAALIAASLKLDEESSAESSLKQERKERARLFMEKILNEKLSAKKRVQGALTEQLLELSSSDSLTPNPIVVTNAAEPSSFVPKIKANVISELIDQEIQKVFTSSPLLAPIQKRDSSLRELSKERKRHDSKRSNSNEKNRKRRRRSRSRKRSRSRSNSSLDVGDEERTKSRERKSKKNKSSKKQSHRRSSTSQSRSRYLDRF